MKKRKTKRGISVNIAGAFERSVRLTTAGNSDPVHNDFENGILTITLPKSEKVKPKTITVKPK